MFRAILWAMAAPAASAPAPPPIPVVMPPVLVVNPWPTPRPWLISKGTSYCSADQFLPAANAAVLLDAENGKFLFVAAPDITVKRKKPEAIELRLDGRTFQGLRAVGYQTDPVMKGFMVWIDDAFLEAFAAARTLQVVRNGQSLMTINLAGSAATMKQLRKCFGQVSAEWAAIPKISPPMAPPPPPRRFPSKVVATNVWVEEDDYPARAQAAGAEGKVRARVDAAANGEATNCTVLESSGNAELDFRTCILMEDRFHYLPALDASGRTYPSTYTRILTWKLEGDAPPPASTPPK